MSAPLVESFRATRANPAAAEEGLSLFKAMVRSDLPRVPGCAAFYRIGHRIHLGRTPKQAAAREYVYRWGLALIPQPRNAGIFGAPHTLGLDGVED